MLSHHLMNCKPTFINECLRKCNNNNDDDDDDNGNRKTCKERFSNFFQWCNIAHW